MINWQTYLGKNFDCFINSLECLLSRLLFTVDVRHIAQMVRD